MFRINLEYQDMNLKFYSSEDDALRALREGKHKAKELVETLTTFPQYKKLKANDFTIKVHFYEPQLELFPEYAQRNSPAPVMTKVPHGPTLRNLK